MRLISSRRIKDPKHDSQIGDQKRRGPFIPIILACFIILFIPLYILSSVLYRDIRDEVMTNEQPSFQASQIRSVPANLRNVQKFLLGKNKIPFCISSDYVDRISYYNDGTPILHLIMFLPDLAPSKIYDKLHPIPQSPILWSPERIEYSHSILQIDVAPGTSGEGDPALDLMQYLSSWKQFDHPASTYPVEGFDEYDDKWGQPANYYYKGSEPYGILCFGNACSIDFVMNDSLRVDMDISKASIPSALDIIDRFKNLAGSVDCRKSGMG